MGSLLQAVATVREGEQSLKRGHATGAEGDPKPARGGTAIRVAARVHGTRVGLIAILVVTTIGIVFAPLGLQWIAKVRRDWVLLGNVGQAYGGVSALISAIALVGVVVSLLVQARQHSLDRITSIRGRQAQIYAIVREDPQLYWPIIGGDFDNERSVQRWTFTIEFLQYNAAGYETGLVPEKNLRNEVFPAFFRYEENRKYWEITNRDWLELSLTKRGRRFVRIANEELAR